MNQDIEIARIRLDGNTQSRVAIHQETVAEYADAISEGASLPPVVVMFDGTDYWLADGFHRLLGNKRLGGIHITADVRPGTARDAQMFAFGANQTHGLRRTNADKRKSIEGMLDLVPEWSDRAIARHVGVAHTAVAAVRDPATEERQKAARKKPAKTTEPVGVESDSNPATSSHEVGSSSAAPERASRAEKSGAEDEAEGDFDPVAELEQQMAINASLQAQIKAAEADDLKAEVIRWKRSYDHAVRQQAEAMERAKMASDREAWAIRQLKRCGKSIGQEDPSKIAAAVEAFMREHKKVAA